MASTISKVMNIKPILLGLLLAAPMQAESPVGKDSAQETATFSMICYWTGEATLGRVEGVTASRIGHWNGNEIVQVDYDPTQTDLATLTKALKKKRAFYSVMVEDGAAQEEAQAVVKPNEVVVASGTPHFIEPKHSLRTLHPDLWALDLDERQAIALNSWSYYGGRMPKVLTDEQMKRWKGR